MDGKGWITGGAVPKPVAIQGRKAIGVARRKPEQKSAVHRPAAREVDPLEGLGDQGGTDAAPPLPVGMPMAGVFPLLIGVPCACESGVCTADGLTTTGLTGGFLSIDGRRPPLQAFHLLRKPGS